MRPLGVTLIAIWFWFRSVFGILLGLGIALAGGLAGRLFSAMSAGTMLPGLVAGLGKFVGFGIVGLSVLTAVAGLGVWLMKSWGRILALALAALSLLFALRILLHPHIGFGVAKLVIDVAILGYLMIPDVQSKFS